MANVGQRTYASSTATVGGKRLKKKTSTYVWKKVKTVRI